MESQCLHYRVPHARDGQGHNKALPTAIMPRLRNDFEDPVLHRLHCPVGNCVQCRCDSGIMPSSSSSSSSLATATAEQRNCSQNCDHRRGISTSSPPPRGGGGNPEDALAAAAAGRCSYEHCEHCQYCVCTLGCSRRRRSSSSIHSDHVTTSVSSSHHVCSCTPPQSSCRHGQATTLLLSRCSCPRWKVALTRFSWLLSRFSGRLRRPQRRRLLKSSSSLHGWERMTSFLYTIITVATFCLSFLPVSDGCSSRSTPKPRPPSPTLRPNITIQTYTCPPEYDAHYCLNGATCFTVKIGESILYNCECAEGYMGQRCEFKDLDGSYLPSKQRAMLEQAGLTSGAVIIVVIVVIVCFYLYVRSRRKIESQSQRLSQDVPDGMECIGYENERRPFSGCYNYQSPSISHSHHHSFHSPPTTPYHHQPLPHHHHHQQEQQQQHHHHHHNQQLPVSLEMGKN